jgi:hypothetical protein
MLTQNSFVAQRRRTIRRHHVGDAVVVAREGSTDRC